jgi:hypothetical protein
MLWPLGHVSEAWQDIWLPASTTVTLQYYYYFLCITSTYQNFLCCIQRSMSKHFKKDWRLLKSWEESEKRTNITQCLTSGPDLTRYWEGCQCSCYNLHIWRQCAWQSVVVPGSMDELCDDHWKWRTEKKVSLNQCQALPNCTLLMKLVHFQLKHKVTTTQLSITDLFV